MLRRKYANREGRWRSLIFRNTKKIEARQSLAMRGGLENRNREKDTRFDVSLRDRGVCLALRVSFYNFTTHYYHTM